ncbi:polygalacturonase-like [Senna tora]|uniref:Polygalacturonase-like n=1 Tax=Senna tora TaxID=362788 RepID=A0A834TM43_9FABA|nr:polygalacturonase-like [Senna tora]
MVQTPAGSDPARLQLDVTSYGGGSQVNMTTGAVNASVTGTVYSDSKLAIYEADKVLLPLDFVLPKAKVPAAAKADWPKSDKNKSVVAADGSGGENVGASGCGCDSCGYGHDMKIEPLRTSLFFSITPRAGSLLRTSLLVRCRCWFVAVAGSLLAFSLRLRSINASVKTVTFIGTENGVRIKSWGRPSNGFAKDILFQHATMINVQNPILIDQNYCPDQKNCPGQVALELTAEDKQQL